MYKDNEKYLFGIPKEEFLEHSEHCHKIFSNIKSGADLYVRIDDRISQSSWDVESETERYIHISILTDEMIEYDSRFFRAEGQEHILDKYRPYFVQFTVPVSNKEQIYKIEEIGYEWRLAKFELPNINYAEQGDQYLDGTLETSASPVVCIEGRLLIFRNVAIKSAVLKTINSEYDPQKFNVTCNRDIANLLNSCWAQDRLNCVDIYNVGHGNADYIRGSHKRILYDIGYNYRCYPRQYPHKSRFWRAVTAIRHLKPSCVIISHWDLDHIIGCAYSKQNVFDVPWVAPHLVSNRDQVASTNSVRLAHYLHSLGKLYLVDRNQSGQLIATISGKHTLQMKLWLGQGGSICSVKNREGLFIEIIGKLRILLGGDVPYSCMPKHIFCGKINYMHVPHHCSNMELKPLASLQKLGEKGMLSVISTNRLKNGHLNCDKNHYNLLKQIFDKVMSTIDSPSKNDEKNLSIRISYKNDCWRIR